MRAAAEVQIVKAGLWFWQVYEPAVKTELCSCAFETGKGLVVCDPVPLDELALEELMDGRNVAGIILTNANHERASAKWAKRLGVEIWAAEGARGKIAATRWFGAGESLFGCIETIGLDGFAKGEVALILQSGILAVGDALIHAAPFGFAMLPDKYCEDAKTARQSLRKLSALPVETIMFAHGLPIVARAAERLAALIG